MIKNVLKNVLKVSAAILLTAGIFSGCTAINDGGTFDYEQDFSSARSVSLNSTKRNVIYVSKLSDLKSSDLNAYTHICVAFAKLDFDVWVNPENDDDKRMIIGTVDGHLDKEAFKSKLSNFKTSDGAAVNSRKVLISLAGGDNEQAVAVYHTLQNSTRRANLINDLRDLTETYNLGGVDLDWEYFSSTFTKVNNYDKSSYDYSGIDVYTKCNNRYVYFVNHLVDDWVGEKPADGYRNTIITIAAQTGSKFTGDDAIRQMLTKLDFVSVMTYDYESSSKVSYTGDFNETKATIETYTGIVGAKNVNIGLPFYGCRYVPKDSGYKMEKKIGYYDLKKEFGSASITYDQNNGVAKCKSGSNYYTFDDPVTIATKISWALEKQLGGAMAWRCDQDKDRVLRDAVVTALNAAGGSSNNNNNNSGSSSPVNLKFDSGYTPDYVEYFDTSRGTGTLYKTSQIDGFTWSSTNGGSLKCSVNSSATSISIYIKYTNAPQNGLVKFDAWAKNNNFGKSIRKVSAIEQYTASGEFVKSLIGSGRNVPYANDYKFGAIEASSSLDGSSTSGWIRLKFARDAAASGEAIYIDNFRIE